MDFVRICVMPPRMMELKVAVPRAEFAAKIKEKESLKKERERKRRYQRVRLQKREDEEV